MTNTAVLGLGAMGSGMAKNFASAGHDVIVWNRTPSRAEELASLSDNIAVAATPRAAAQEAWVIVSIVTDDDASHAVWLDDATGAVSALDDSKIVIESSTVTPAWAIEVGHAVTATGATFIEAPVVGSRPQLSEGSLVYLLGGSNDAVAAATPTLEVNGAALKHVGPVGHAATMKLAINGLFGVQIAAFAEIVGFIERSGMNRDSAIDALTALPITSPALQRILGLFKASDYSPSFPIDLVAKDLRYLVDTAQTVGAATPAATAVRDAFELAGSEGYGDDDIAGIAQRYF